MATDLLTTPQVVFIPTLCVLSTRSVESIPRRGTAPASAWSSIHTWARLAHPACDSDCAQWCCDPAAVRRVSPEAPVGDDRKHEPGLPGRVDVAPLLGRPGAGCRAHLTATIRSPSRSRGTPSTVAAVFKQPPTPSKAPWSPFREPSRLEESRPRSEAPAFLRQTSRAMSRELRCLCSIPHLVSVGRQRMRRDLRRRMQPMTSSACSARQP